jgi:hypothetical protein
MVWLKEQITSCWIKFEACGLKLEHHILFGQKQSTFVAFLINHLPIRKNLHVTSFQRLFKIKLTFDHVRMFGNQMFIFIAKDKQNKLRPKSKIGQLLRYDEKIKGYHC